MRSEVRRGVLRHAGSRREASPGRNVRPTYTPSPSAVEASVIGRFDDLVLPSAHAPRVADRRGADLSRKKKEEPKTPVKGSICEVCGKPTDEHNNLAYMRCMILGYQRPQDIQPAKTSGTLSDASG